MNMTNLIVTEGWNYCRLAVILFGNNKNWYINKTWELDIYDGFIPYCYEVDSEKRIMPNYDKVLKTEYKYWHCSSNYWSNR